MIELLIKIVGLISLAALIIGIMILDDTRVLEGKSWLDVYPNKKRAVLGLIVLRRGAE